MNEICLCGAPMENGICSVHGCVASYGVGSIVVVRLFNGREIVATIDASFDTAGGWKIRVSTESLSVLVNPDQIVKIVKAGQ
jgi:hypothetical protein